MPAYLKIDDIKGESKAAADAPYPVSYFDDAVGRLDGTIDFDAAIVEGVSPDDGATQNKATPKLMGGVAAADEGTPVAEAGLDLSAGMVETRVALLLPAVQKMREAAGRDDADDPGTPGGAAALFDATFEADGFVFFPVEQAAETQHKDWINLMTPTQETATARDATSEPDAPFDAWGLFGAVETVDDGFVF